MFYGRKIFDPLYIIAQMLILQSSFYLFMGFFVFLFHSLFGAPLTIRLILSASAVNVSSFLGWECILSFSLTALLCSIVALHVVARAKLCLDFVGTIYFFHTINCTAYDSFPKNGSWWALNFIACTASVVLAEYLCMRKELQEIPKFLNVSTAAATSSSSSAEEAPRSSTGRTAGAEKITEIEKESLMRPSRNLTASIMEEEDSRRRWQQFNAWNTSSSTSSLITGKNGDAVVLNVNSLTGKDQADSNDYFPSFPSSAPFSSSFIDSESAAEEEKLNPMDF